MRLELYGEYCCEICGEIIHYHFDCPACNKKHAGTNYLSGYHSEWDIGDRFDCENCGATFEFTGINKDEYEPEWKQVN